MPSGFSTWGGWSRHPPHFIVRSRQRSAAHPLNGGDLEYPKLFKLLLAKLSEEELAYLDSLKSGAYEEHRYDGVVRAVRSRIPALKAEVERNRLRVETRYHDVADQPEARIEILLKSSPPTILMALAREFIDQSFKERFGDPAKGCRAAAIALRAARGLRPTGYLGDQSQNDLEGECWMYLANARRVASDIEGAEKALNTAWPLLQEGGGDHSLKAQFCFFSAALRFRQGRVAEAQRLWDKEIKLRRIVRDGEALGTALVSRGVLAAWTDPDLGRACALFEEAQALTADGDNLLLILQALAERLARDGKGLKAWKAICNAETSAVLLRNRGHDLPIRWIKGLTYRALGELTEAEDELSRVWNEFACEERTFQAGVLSLDLASVLIGQGRPREAVQLAEHAYRAFTGDQLERRALAAVLVLRNALEAERVTEALAVRVANHAARSKFVRGPFQ